MAGESGSNPISAQAAAPPPVIDYEGSGYRTEFWEGQGRQYEDATERLAIGQLLPPHGGRIAEIGAGFGRLGDLYAGYERVVLFDYSRTLLGEAVDRWGHDPRFVFAAGNVYQLALASGSLDALVMVRVMHHLADVPRALGQLRRVLHPAGTAVVEYANKRNLKALGRRLLGRQTWSPWDPTPVEFVALNFDFHPDWMNARLEEAQLSVRRQLAVSHFRTPLLKRRVSAGRLAQIDSWLFTLGGRYPLAPSVFVQCQPQPQPPVGVQPAAVRGDAPLTELFGCPACGGAQTLERPEETLLVCRSCHTRYRRHHGIWDFKEPAA